MSLTTTVTSNQPGGASAYSSGLSLPGANQPAGGASSPAQIATQLLQEIQEMVEALSNSASGAGDNSGAGDASSGDMPSASGLPTTGALPATGGSSTNLSSVQLQVGTSGSGTKMMQGPTGPDGSSDLYLPQKDGSEKHVGKAMADGSIQFDNPADAKSVLGKGGTFANAMDGNLQHNSNGTVTLAAGMATLTGGDLPAPG